MISKIFESEKGKAVGCRRTICEIHREIFDQLILLFNDRPKGLKRVVKLLDEAFVVGVKINKKLSEHKLDELYGPNDRKNKDIIREQRNRIVAMLNENKEFLEKYG
jgi:hypothetical protein